jgi:hypothetical protein
VSLPARKRYRFILWPAIVAGMALLVALFVRLTASNALSEALTAVVEGRQIPAHIRLDILGMEVRRQDPSKFRDLLLPGPRVIESHYMWHFFPHRATAFFLETRADVGLICEVYADDGWDLYCGQLRCESKPCVYTIRPDHIVPVGTY